MGVFVKNMSHRVARHACIKSWHFRRWIATFLAQHDISHLALMVPLFSNLHNLRAGFWILKLVPRRGTCFSHFRGWMYYLNANKQILLLGQSKPQHIKVYTGNYNYLCLRGVGYLFRVTLHLIKK